MSAKIDRDSDSSDDESEYNETKTLLGYASEDATDDAFSQLGGHPVRTELSYMLSGRLTKYSLG